VSPDDVVALRHLVDCYADALDRRDAEALRALFTDDGLIRMQSDDGPVEAEWAGQAVGDAIGAVAGYHRTFHHVGGCVFEEDGDGARGRVHCLAHHYERTGNGPVDLVMMIRYHDRYRRAGVVWRISERRVSVEWTELHPAHPKRKVRH
jgi:SnoaL-like protein